LVSGKYRDLRASWISEREGNRLRDPPIGVGRDARTIHASFEKEGTKVVV